MVDDNFGRNRVVGKQQAMNNYKKHECIVALFSYSSQTRHYLLISGQSCFCLVSNRENGTRVNHKGKSLTLESDWLRTFKPRINHSSCILISRELQNKDKSPHLHPCLRALGQSDCRISGQNQLSLFGIIE